MLRIDIAFDLVCPWCLIGKRQLDLALQAFGRLHPDTCVQKHWHAVQLLPQLPADGIDFRTFYEQRMGSLAAVKARQADVLAAATAVGLTINFDKIRILPNTARAHALLAHAAQHLDAASHTTLLERLFAAYFEHGEDIGEVETLTVIAAAWGFDPIEISALLADTRALPLPGIAGLGRAGVPHFVINQRFQLNGAQSATVLLTQMEVAIEVTHPLFEAKA